MSPPNRTSRSRYLQQNRPSMVESGTVPIVVPKRGRPKKESTIVVSVRIPEAAYDAYCRCANACLEDVRTIMRHVLTLHAPRR